MGINDILMPESKTANQWPVNDCIGPFKGEYRYLSNFWETDIVLGNTVFPTAEHAFQAAKAVDQPDIYEEIVNASSPKKAKRKGKKPDLPENWYENKKYVMANVVTAKFSQNPELRRRLIDTGDTPLVELNSWGDTYWGAKKSNGEGKNALGVILMETRSTLKELDNL